MFPMMSSIYVRSVDSAPIITREVMSVLSDRSDSTRNHFLEVVWART
jgi:hypothetical protein